VMTEMALSSSRMLPSDADKICTGATLSTFASSMHRTGQEQRMIAYGAHIKEDVCLYDASLLW